MLPLVDDMDWDTPSQNITMNPVEAVEPMDTNFNWWLYDATHTQTSKPAIRQLAKPPRRIVTARRSRKLTQQSMDQFLSYPPGANLKTSKEGGGFIFTKQQPLTGGNRGVNINSKRKRSSVKTSIAKKIKLSERIENYFLVELPQGCDEDPTDGARLLRT